MTMTVMVMAESADGHKNSVASTFLRSQRPREVDLDAAKLESLLTSLSLVVRIPRPASRRPPPFHRHPHATIYTVQGRVSPYVWPYRSVASDSPDSALAHVLLRPYGIVVALSSAVRTGLFTSVVVASLLDLALPSMAAKTGRMTNRAANYIPTPRQPECISKTPRFKLLHLLALH